MDQQPITRWLLMAVWLIAVLLLSILSAVGAYGSYPVGWAELLVNGDFEAGDRDWAQSSAGGFGLVSQFNPRAGAWGAYLGGYDDADDRLSQPMILPGDAISITLGFWWSIATEERGGVRDTLTLSLLRPDGTLLADLMTLDNTAPANLWQEASVDMTVYVGQPVVLRFWARTDANLSTDFYVDDVSVRACSPEPTPPNTATAPSATATPTPGPSASYLPYMAVRGGR
jgi:hypothetical protein